MKPAAVAFCLAVAGLLFFLVWKAGEAESPPAAPETLSADQKIEESVEHVNQWLRHRWSAEGLEPAQPADDLTVYRRLSLALHGTIPSLEEVHAFVSDRRQNRIERWVLKLLDDERFPEYFATRLARVLTGTEEGQFVIFRRDMLEVWLARQLRSDRPWHEITEDLIAGDGLWTSNGNTNFITAASVDGEGLDENKLAGRTVRAFLGQRIDCAQCHDHPFDQWKQADFEGLAAWFGQARVTPGGVVDRTVEDGKPVEYMITDPGEEDPRLVRPRVPFHEDWISGKGSRRRQLAGWVVHPDNRRFERAVSNRIWGLMFGRAWWDPVDDLPHPEENSEEQDLLDVLGAEFRRNGGRLRFLIRLIAESDAFRVDSRVPGVDEETFARMGDEWARFPLVRLRPEQMIGAMFQAGHTKTIDRNSNIFARFVRFTNESDFLKQYGDADDDELIQQSGTIPQALLRMNGEFTRKFTETELLAAAGQIMQFSGNDEKAVENCYLACLTRWPDAEEKAYFVAELKEAADRQPMQRARRRKQTAETSESSEEEKATRRTRQQIIRDLYWALFNSPGFSWNR